MPRDLSETAHDYGYAGGYGGGIGRGDGVGYGHGLGGGYGNGCRPGGGYGCDGGYGLGYLSGGGHGYRRTGGTIIGSIGEHTVYAHIPWGVVRSGCEVLSVAEWRERWRELAGWYEIDVDEDVVEVLLERAAKEGEKS